MQIKIEQFQKIEKADIKLNNITLVAGNNDTGKSTISKVIYSIIKSDITYVESFLESIKTYINDEFVEYLYEFLLKTKFDINKIEENFKLTKKNKSKSSDLESFLFFGFRENDELYEFSYKLLKENFVDILSLNKNKYIEVKKFVENFNNFKMIIKNNFEEDENKDNFLKKCELLEKYIKTLNSKDKKMMLHPNINKYFRREFGAQSLIDQKSKIQLEEENGFNIDISFGADISSLRVNDVGIDSSIKNIIYIESPYLLLFDSMMFMEENDVPFHIMELMQMLKKEPKVKEIFKYDLDNILFENSKNIIYTEIKDIIKSEIKYNTNDKVFELIKDDGQKCSMMNTASGIKSLGIIQKLIDNNFIGNDTILILDEPEVNLHPDWQVKLSKIIVLMSQYYNNLKIFINTHSPYIIQGIFHYSSENLVKKQYEDSKTKIEVEYYLSKEGKETDKNVFDNVSEDISVIFNELSTPLQNIVWR